MTKGVARRKFSEPPRLAEEETPYLDQLAGELEISFTDLEKELAAQPGLLYRVARELVSRAKARDARRRALVAARTSVEETLRRSAKEHDVETTSVAIAYQVESQATVVRAVKAADEANQRWHQVHALYRAFRERGRMLESMVQLQTKR